MAKKKKPRSYNHDDDADVLKVMASLLKGAGFSVTTSTKSADVITDIARKKPDCVIGDLMMPEVDGLQLCKMVIDHKALKKPGSLSFRPKPTNSTSSVHTISVPTGTF